MSTPLRRLRSLGLGPRIALTMLGAIFAIQALNSLLFFFLPRPELKIYSTRWIVAATEDVVLALKLASPSDQEEIANRFLIDTGLTLRPERGEPPYPRRIEFPAMQRLEDSLKAALAGKVRKVEVRGIWGQPGPPPDLEPVTMPPDSNFALPRGALAPTEPDIPIWGRFEIVFQSLDGRTFKISPPPPPHLGVNPALISIAGAVILVTLLSARTAKRTLRPLDELVAAARRLGVERQPSPIATERLYDFAAIGEAMNEMQVRIKDYVAERTQILAAISHDLRTALTRFRLNAETMRDGEIRERMISDIQEMERMISATLAFAGDDLKGERSEPLDIAALLITICDNFSDTGVAVRYEGPDHAQITCQPTAMRRAITNLVENGVKYGQEAHVVLTVGRKEIIVTVSDKGPGIPPDLVELVFQPFRRLEQSRNRGTGGVGLGLTIARDIVRAHGGTLTLANGTIEGLVATLRLPTT